ncbi:hypothetical protein DEI91_09660 [Curtobacterium sp. MCBD17_032]|nr:hypothetical protein DEI91_09660 [Curtobacterium sp. MCBD17_032]
MDDCAAFCSHVLWGGKPGPILWVDNFKTAGDGTYAPGAGDLAPWDVLLFDWEGNGVGNHVEFMVADLGNGFVRTFGANGSDSREARYRTRPKRYILGRFRPGWSAALVVPPKLPAPIIDQEDDDMLILDNGHGQGLLSGGKLTSIPSPDDVRALRKAKVKVAKVSPEFYNRLRETAK